MLETAKIIASVIENATKTFSRAKQLLETPEQIQAMGSKLEQLYSEFELIRQAEKRISEVIQSVDPKESFGNVQQSGSNNTVQQGKNINIGNNASGGNFTLGNITI